MTGMVGDWLQLTWSYTYSVSALWSNLSEDVNLMPALHLFIWPWQTCY